MFNELRNNRPGFDENRLEKEFSIPADIMDSLFSVDTFRVSKKSILASLQVLTRINIIMLEMRLHLIQNLKMLRL
jgi:hypothetical protein